VFIGLHTRDATGERATLDTQAVGFAAHVLGYCAAVPGYCALDAEKRTNELYIISLIL